MHRMMKKFSPDAPKQWEVPKEELSFDSHNTSVNENQDQDPDPDKATEEDEDLR